MLCDYEPRQEPGRYLDRTVVPSAGRPQRQPFTAIGPADRFAATAGTPPTSGTRVTLPAGKPPPLVATTMPFASAVRPPTDFDGAPSQPPPTPPRRGRAPGGGRA